jgi:quinol monooxygenase YgiN
MVYGNLWSDNMLIVNVHISVKPGMVDDFIEATKKNAAASLNEPGIARFDLIQQQDDSTRFILVEAYKDDEAPAKHKDTAHYIEWRETVAPMMAVPREGIKHVNIYPGDDGW